MDDDDRWVLGAAAGRVVDVVTAAAADLDAGLTPPQLRVVTVLHEQGPSSVSAVAAATRSAVSSASRTADRLSALGLLERVPAPGDRREVLLRLTRRGRATAQDWVRRRSEALAAALQDWPAERRAALTALLREDRAVQASVAAAEPDAGGGTAVHAAPVDGTPVPGAVPHAALRSALLEAVRAAEADHAVEALCAAAARELGAAAVQLLLLSRSGADLLPAPAAGPGPHGALPHEPMAVEGPGGAAEALRRTTALAERRPGRLLLHAPVVGRREVVGVLSAVLPDGADPAPDAAAADSADTDSADTALAALQVAADAVALLLPAASAGDRRLEQRRRDHEWTVSAEVQDRQLGPGRLQAPGAVAAAQLQPAWSVCTDAHDLDVVATGPHAGAVDAVVLDCRSGRRTAPLAAAVALAALRHARGLGRGLSEAASLADEAVHDAFGGAAAVDLVLVRVAADGRSAVALATELFTVHRLRDGVVDELPLAVHEAAGGTGGALYAERPLDVRAGDRLVLVGDGANRHSGAVPVERVEQLVRETAAAAPHEVVRRLVLDRTAAEPEPQEDATAVCLDLRDAGPEVAVLQR